MATKAACAIALAISFNSSTASASVLATTSASSATSANTQRLLRKRTNAKRRKLLHNNVQNSPNSPGRASRRGLCLDDASYRSKIGFTCKAIRQAGLNCDGFADLGFTPDETDQLKMSCPNACGRCTDEMNQSLSISTVASTSTPTNAPSMAPTTSRPTLTNSGMGTCFDDSCTDDPLYVGRYNIDCEVVRSGTFDCTNFGVMNYDDDEVAELIAKCPCACNIDCIASDAPSGMPSLPPTHKPMSAAPSTHPTSHPSASPSASPSAAPSFAPSSSPSAPESALPTMSPTVTFSSSPSLNESASPSTSPSTSPSLNPTTSHSHAPSRSPASPAPSTNPSASPTTAQLRTPSTPLPSVAPTLRDSDIPSALPSRHVFESGNPSSNPTLSPVRVGVAESVSSSQKDEVSSNTQGALMSDEGTTNFDMRTDLNYEVIDISARTNVVEGEEQMDEEPNQTSGSASTIGASVAISLVLLHAISSVTSELW